MQLSQKTGQRQEYLVDCFWEDIWKSGFAGVRVLCEITGLGMTLIL